MKAMELNNEFKAMGQAAVQGFEQASSTFLQMHKQGSDALIQMVDFGFGAMEAMARPTKEAMVEWTQKLGGQASAVENPMEAWEKGMKQAHELCKEAISKWTQAVQANAGTVMENIKAAQPK